MKTVLLEYISPFLAIYIFITFYYLKKDTFRLNLDDLFRFPSVHLLHFLKYGNEMDKTSDFLDDANSIFTKF